MAFSGRFWKRHERTAPVEKTTSGVMERHKRSAQENKREPFYGFSLLPCQNVYFTAALLQCSLETRIL